MWTTYPSSGCGSLPELAGVNLVPVDVIGTAEDLSAFADDSLDFVIGNHLFEHLEYPIGALLEFQRVLRAGGVAYLALPDKRLTFDKRRDLTSIEHLVQEQREGLEEQNRRAHYLDWAENVGREGSGGRHRGARGRTDGNPVQHPLPRLAPGHLPRFPRRGAP